MLIELSNEDKEAICAGLNMKICFIQTRNPLLTATDMARQDKPVKALDEYQMRQVLKLRDLEQRLCRAFVDPPPYPGL